MVYLLSGTSYAARLLVSIVSLRRHFNGPVVVLTADAAAAQLASQMSSEKSLQVTVQSIETMIAGGRKGAYLFKPLLFRHTPFQRCLYLDCDTLIQGPIDELFDLPDDRHIGVTQFCGWITSGRTIAKRIRSWRDTHPELVQPAIDFGPAINTGVFAFTSFSEAFRRWNQVATTGRHHFIPDEISLQLLLPTVPHVLHDGRFNCSSRYGDWRADDVRVIHCHGNKHLRTEFPVWRAAFESVAAANLAGIREWMPAGDRALKRYLKTCPIALGPPVQRCDSTPFLKPGATTGPNVTNPSGQRRIRTGAFSARTAAFRTRRGKWQFDASFAAAIDSLCEPRRAWSRKTASGRILDAGAGIGLYTRRWKHSVGIDGIPGIEALSEGHVQERDLTEPELVKRLGQFRWVTCLEVGEHVPRRRTEALLTNLTKIAQDGIVCSWAPPGQPGNGHINCRTPDQVRGLFARFGWRENPLESRRLRAAATLEWFRTNTLVFRPVIPKVFGIGLPKTGTNSLNDALNRLGIRSVHHPVDGATKRELRQGAYRLQILDDYDALTDMQAAAFFRELDQTWPDSRFILTTRPIPAWLDSADAHFHRVRPRKPGSFGHWLRTAMFGTALFHRERFEAVARRHVADVRDWFQAEGRRERFLELPLTRQSGRRNWRALAEFFGVDPPDVEFPWSNRRPVS